MKYLLILIATLLLSSCLEEKYPLTKSINITAKGDTIVTYGGVLCHYDNGTYKIVHSVE